jgi:hypothetical protein
MKESNKFFNNLLSFSLVSEYEFRHCRPVKTANYLEANKVLYVYG